MKQKTIAFTLSLLLAAMGSGIPASAVSASALSVGEPEAHVGAAPVKLGFPLDCTLGKDCWIGRYVDRTKGPGISDYMCGNRTQDSHAGTDIAVADLGRMKKGVNVLATAPGTVIRMRDGVADESVRVRGMAAIKGRECGNGLVIRHRDGYESQYCHLKKGSFKVKVGDRVQTGEPVAELGLSGETEYPHVHYMVRKDGKVIDPFDGGGFEAGCKSGDGALWADKIAYEPFVILPLQFSASARKRGSVWDAPAEKLPADSPALVLMARAFHVHKGDRWHMAIYDPRGRIYAEKDMVMPADKQFYYQYIGRSTRGAQLMPGLWSGVIMVQPAGGSAGAKAGGKTVKIRAHVLVPKE